MRFSFLDLMILSCLSSFSRVASRINAVFVGQYPSSSMTCSILSTSGAGNEIDKKTLRPLFFVDLERRTRSIDGGFSALIRLMTHDLKLWTSVIRQGVLDGTKPKFVAFNLEPCLESRCPFEHSACSVLNLHF